MQFIFPKKLATLLSPERTKKNVYKTSDCHAGYAFFAVLKMYCKAGVIKNYNKQIAEMAEACSASPRSIYNYLKQTEKLNLLSIANGNIYLKSWRKVLDTWGISPSEILFHKLKIEVTNIKPKYLIELCEIIDASENMAKGFIVKKAKHSDMSTAYKKCAIHFGIPVEYSTENHLKLQELCFRHGFEAESYNLLFSLNPDFQRSMRKLKEVYNYQAQNAPSYHRKQLEKLGLIKVTKRLPISCDTKRILGRKANSTHLTSITCLGLSLKLKSNDNAYRYGYVPKGYSKRFNLSTGVANWFMPFKIEINPKIIIN